MKRFFILASAAIVALASCAKTEVVSNNEPQEIAFKQLAGPMTKAEALKTDMGVFAYTADGSKYFGPVQFINKDGVWKGNPSQYYPLQTALDFACYSPCDGFNNWSYDNTNQTLTSPVFADVKAVDVLYGEKIYADCSKKSSPVSVLFKHALAQVSVKVSSNVPAAITVNSVTLKGLCTGGKVTVDYDKDAWNKTTWGEKVPNADYLWTKQDDFTLTDTAAEFGAPIFFVPGDSDTAVNQTSFVVSYTMNEVTMTATVTLNGIWEMGKHYIYTLKADLNEITFAPEVQLMDVVETELTL